MPQRHEKLVSSVAINADDQASLAGWIDSLSLPVGPIRSDRGVSFFVLSVRKKFDEMAKVDGSRTRIDVWRTCAQ